MINDYDVTQPMNTDAGNAGSRGESMGNDEVISTLNNLIETSRDGQEGFREAAEANRRLIVVRLRRPYQPGEHQADDQLPRFPIK